MELAKKTEELLGKIKVIRSNPHYRMADVFYRKGLRYGDSTKNVKNLHQFDGTILKNYILQVSDVDSPDIALLSQIVSDWNKIKNVPIAQEDEAVMHIRAGDVVVSENFLKQDFSGNLKLLPGLKKCNIVICFAFQEFQEIGFWMYTDDKLAKNISMFSDFLNKIMLENRSIEFDIVSNDDVDRDFVYMVQAKNFVRDEGGFSDLICDLRAYRSFGIIPSIKKPSAHQQAFCLAQNGALDQAQYKKVLSELRESGSFAFADYLVSLMTNESIEENRK